MPGALSTSMSPQLCFTIPKTMGSPNPVPLPCSFVVKNGSKRRPLTSSPMPTPVSRTLKQTSGPMGRSGRVSKNSSGGLVISVSRKTVPPSGMASRAFMARFNTTCSICPESTLARQGAGNNLTCSTMFSPIIRRSIPPMSLTTLFISTTCGASI